MKQARCFGILMALGLLAVGCGGGSTDDRDASIDAATEEDAAAEEDAATEEDAGVEATPCEQACSAAAEAGCLDNSTCAADICSFRDVSLECIAEADAYLECIGASDVANDFACIDDKPEYLGSGCDLLFESWAICYDASAQ